MGWDSSVKVSRGIYLKHFRGSIFSAIIGLLLAGGIGFYYSGSLDGVTKAVFAATILAVLEISLSFDNAIVNAGVLERMTPEWQHRFLTWGMIIAVFFMRLMFPLIIVSAVARINPFAALNLALFKPSEYAQTMLSAHVPVAAFGGTFLLLVALKYFFDEKKDEHWLHWIEAPLAKLGRLEAFELAIAIITVIVLKKFVRTEEQEAFLISGIWGVITFIAIDGLASYLKENDEQNLNLQKASLGLFIYLEVLDASFSFDGVVGAFAISNNIFIIMIGLGIGAFFVRSLTLLFIEKKSLSKFIYLEHGAYYAIGTLAFIMLLSPIFEIPEWITGSGGGAIILISFLSSLRVKS